EEVPMPVNPLPSTVKSSAPVVEAIVKSFVKGDDCVEVETASCENGDVVPMPNAVVVADCPNCAWVNGSEPPPPPVAEIVIGEEPMMVKDEQDALPEQEAVVVATDW